MRVEVPHSDDGQGLDVCRTVKSLIDRHGPDARLVALRWSDCATRAGDPARAAAWRRVVDAIARADTLRSSLRTYELKCFFGARAA